MAQHGLSSTRKHQLEAKDEAPEVPKKRITRGNVTLVEQMRDTELRRKAREDDTVKAAEQL
jgi:hypothetical protein